MGEKERIIELIKKIVRGEEGGKGGDSNDVHTEEHILHEAVLISDRINIVVKKEEDGLAILKELRDMLVIPAMTVPQQLRAVKLLEVLVSNCRVLRVAISKDKMWTEFLYTLVTVRFNKPETEAVQAALVTAISHWSDFAFSAIGNDDKLFDQFLALYGDLVKFGMSIITINSSSKKEGGAGDDKGKKKDEDNACDWANYSGDEDDPNSDIEDYDERPKSPSGSDNGENTIEIRQTENSKTVTFTPRKTKIKLSSNLALANGVRQNAGKSTDDVGWFRSLFGRRSSATPEEIKENGLVYVNELLNYVKILREGRLLLESQIIRANELMSLLNELLKPLTELLNADFVTKNDKLVMDLLDINETAVKYSLILNFYSISIHSFTFLFRISIRFPIRIPNLKTISTFHMSFSPCR